MTQLHFLSTTIILFMYLNPCCTGTIDVKSIILEKKYPNQDISRFYMQLERDGYQEKDEIHSCPSNQVLTYNGDIHEFFKDEPYMCRNGECKCTVENDDQVTKFEKCNTYPSNWKHCLWWDHKGMKHNKNVEVGDKCWEWCKYTQDEDREWLEVRNGYCAPTGVSDGDGSYDFKCGTGVCCRDAENQNDVIGCHCENDEWPYISKNAENKEQCRYSRRLGMKNRHGCQPSVKAMLCHCTELEAKYYSDENSIRQPCTTCNKKSYTTNCGGKSKGACTFCPPGKFQDEDDTLLLECPNCVAGKFSLQGSSTCTACTHGKYAPEGSESCKDCQACPEGKNTYNPICMDRKVGEGECVCTKGYYRPREIDVCTPIAKGSYKHGYGDEISIDNSGSCIAEKGEGFTTIYEGSTSINDCVCDKNWELDDKGKCKQCSFKDNTPYKPINETKCRACHIYEYWNDFAKECTPLDRLSFSFFSQFFSQFNIINTDKYRPKGELMINQQKSLSLPPNHYLDIETHQPKRCLPCQAPFHKREACGKPQIMNNEERIMWVRWIDGNNIPRENRLTIPIPYDESNGFNSYDWWKHAHDNLNLTIIREGRCRRCSECPKGHYQTDCLDESNSGCVACVTKECSSNEYYYHNHSNYEGQESDREWKGGCERSPNIAQEPYECRPCRTWTREGDQYYLLLTCGEQTSQIRWDPNSVEEHLLAESEEDNTDQNQYSAYKQKIPYCAPGWYVDLNDDNCPLDSDHDYNEPWNENCCKKCGDSNAAQLKKASDYTPCTGHTVRNTETYTDRCENGYYSEKINGIGACKACTMC